MESNRRPNFTDWNVNIGGMTMATLDSATHRPAVDVGATSVLIVPANPSRVFCAVAVADPIADGKALFISTGVTAAADKGYPITARGGYWDCSLMQGNNWTGAIYAIYTGTGTIKALVTEGIINVT